MWIMEEVTDQLNRSLEIREAIRAAILVAILKGDKLKKKNKLKLKGSRLRNKWGKIIDSIEIICSTTRSIRKCKINPIIIQVLSSNLLLKWSAPFHRTKEIRRGGGEGRIVSNMKAVSQGQNQEDKNKYIKKARKWNMLKGKENSYKMIWRKILLG